MKTLIRNVIILVNQSIHGSNRIILMVVTAIVKYCRHEDMLKISMHEIIEIIPAFLVTKKKGNIVQRFTSVDRYCISIITISL